MPRRAAPDRTPHPLDEVMARLERMVASHPGVDVGGLQAMLDAEVATYNRAPQSGLGGLSPVDVHRLVGADWAAADGPIVLASGARLEELAAARAVHDARLLLAMLLERESVKATPSGNLPREFVAEFRRRMGRATPFAEDGWLVEHPVRNEEDLEPLHRTRVLLDVAGLLQRRSGKFRATRRGDRLAAAERAGALLALLVRAHFTRLSLAWLDRADEAPAFQRCIGYTLYQFAQHGGEWRTPAELKERIVLPAVREEIREWRGVDTLALILETRFLRPLERFGLADTRRVPREDGPALERFAYRKTPLLDRVVSFRVR